MASLPLISPRLREAPTIKNTSSLYSHPHPVTSPYPFSQLQLLTRKAVAEKRYFHIDFNQSGDCLLSTHDRPNLQQSSQPTEERQRGREEEEDEGQLEDKSGLRGVIEQSQWLRSRKKRWKGVLSMKETQLSFGKMGEKISPDRLEEYLERKKNEEIWRKISMRESQLCNMVERTKEHSSKLKPDLIGRSRQRSYYQAEGKRKVPLETLHRLNQLLQQ